MLGYIQCNVQCSNQKERKAYIDPSYSSLPFKANVKFSSRVEF